MKKIIINIGRQFGSGGKAVADKIGEILGIPVYDNELLAKAAQDFGFTEELFRNRDEKKRSLTLSSIFSSSIFGGGSYLTDDSALFKMQAQTIRNIAEKGSAVIVGRAADYILRDMDCCLDVFLTAPLSFRTERVAERMGMPAESARDFIGKKEKERENFYNCFTFGNWGVASTYDLCVDTSLLGVEGTAEFIIEFAKLSQKL